MRMLRKSETLLASALVLSTFVLVNCGRTAKSEDESKRGAADAAAAAADAATKAKIQPTGGAPATTAYPAIDGSWVTTCVETAKFSADLVKAEPTVKKVTVTYVFTPSASGADGKYERTTLKYASEKCETAVGDPDKRSGTYDLSAPPTESKAKLNATITFHQGGEKGNDRRNILALDPTTGNLSVGPSDEGEVPKEITMVLIKILPKK